MRCLCFIVIFMIGICPAGAQNADYRFLKACNAGNLPVWDKTMNGLTYSAYPVSPLAVGSVWLYGWHKKDKEMMRHGYKSILTLGMASGITIVLKKMINRPRPFIAYPNDIIKRTDAGPHSFPSGHTTATFASATALTLSTKKWEVALPAFVYAGMVGYSRLRLGVHYPSDVLAGAVIGVGSGFLIWEADKWFRKRQAAKKSRIAE